MGLWSRLFGPGEPPVVPVHIDDENFAAEILRSSEPIVLDVWGPDCAPCRQLEPIILRLARRYRGRIKVAELNAAAAPRSARRLNVRGTPTVIYYRGGRDVERVVGFRGEAWHDEIVTTELLGDGAERS